MKILTFLAATLMCSCVFGQSHLNPKEMEELGEYLENNPAVVTETKVQGPTCIKYFFDTDSKLKHAFYLRTAGGLWVLRQVSTKTEEGDWVVESAR